MNKENYFAEDPSQIEFGKVEETIIPADQQANQGADDSQPDKPQKKNHDSRRWDRMLGKLEETTEEVSELRKFKQEVEAGKFTQNNYAPVPEHFKKMYEDGLSLEERWAMQMQYDQNREAEIIQKAQKAALDTVTQQQQEQTKWEGYIDEQLESLEDQYEIDFTSGSTKAEKLKKDFLKTIAKLSPKDEQGRIVQYASFDDTFEFWADNKGFNKQGGDNANVDRKKDLASMGNNRPAVAPASNEPGEGGMWGWKKDLPSNG